MIAVLPQRCDPRVGEGPFPITPVKGPLSYDVWCGPHQWNTKTLHIKLMKEWHEPAPEAQVMAWSEQQLTHLTSRNLPWGSIEHEKAEPPVDAGLNPKQPGQVYTLLTEIAYQFSTQPSCTKQVQHVIIKAIRLVCWSPVWPIPQSHWNVVDQEIREMLQFGVWQSPIVLLPKPDGSIRFCIYSWEVNKISSFNAYLMLRDNVLLSQLGEASYECAQPDKRLLAVGMGGM